MHWHVIFAVLQCVESWGRGKVQLWAREVLGLEEADVLKLKRGGSHLLTTSREALGLSADALTKVQLAIDSGNFWVDDVRSAACWRYCVVAV